MSAEILIRPIAPADEKIWHQLFANYLATDGSKVKPEILNATFDRLSDSHFVAMSGLLAFVKKQPVGFVHYLTHPSTWNIENITYIQDLFVDKSVRKQGIGEKLIARVYEIADQEGAPQVYWMTQGDNKTARSLYDKIATNTNYVKYQRPSP